MLDIRATAGANWPAARSADAYPRLRNTSNNLVNALPAIADYAAYLVIEAIAT